MNGRINEQMNEWMNEWGNEWTNEWMNERTNEWMNEWMNEILAYLFPTSLVLWTEWTTTIKWCSAPSPFDYVVTNVPFFKHFHSLLYIPSIDFMFSMVQQTNGKTVDGKYKVCPSFPTPVPYLHNVETVDEKWKNWYLCQNHLFHPF